MFRQTLCGLLLVAASGAQAADTVKIALTGPFSGGSAPMGTSARDRGHRAR